MFKVTSIFQDGRGFVQGPIFVPSPPRYDSIDIQDNGFNTKKPVIVLDTDFPTQKSGELITTPVTTETDYHMAAQQAYESVFKKKDSKYETLKTSFEELAFRHLYQQAEKEYNSYLAKKEKRIRSEAKLALEKEEYNREYYAKLQAKIQRIEAKKKLKREYLSFFMGLLFGDEDDPSIPKPFLGILTAPHPGFIKFCKIIAKRVNPISAIAPIKLRFGESFYSKPPEVSVNFKINNFIAKVFAGIYRTWSNQFVRKIIEKRQRGPPSPFAFA